jgi:hypothetical protein
MIWLVTDHAETRTSLAPLIAGKHYEVAENRMRRRSPKTHPVSNAHRHHHRLRHAGQFWDIRPGAFPSRPLDARHHVQPSGRRVKRKGINERGRQLRGQRLARLAGTASRNLAIGRTAEKLKSATYRSPPLSCRRPLSTPPCARNSSATAGCSPRIAQSSARYSGCSLFSSSCLFNYFLLLNSPHLSNTL